MNCIGLVSYFSKQSATSATSPSQKTISRRKRVGVFRHKVKTTFSSVVLTQGSEPQISGFHIYNLKEIDIAEISQPIDTIKLRAKRVFFGIS